MDGNISITLFSFQEYMSQQDENKKNAGDEFNKIWDEYKKALDNWEKTYDSWQQATNGTLVMYTKIWQKMVESNPGLLKKLADEWMKTWNQAGIEQVTQFSKIWQNTLNTSGIESMNKFNESWEKSWTSFGSEQFKEYSKALQKFTETWQNTWKK